MTDLPASLSTRLAASATGYGAVIDGVLNIRTVSETPNMVALNALFLVGIHVQNPCQDLCCDCIVRIARQLRPDIWIVSVSVEVSE